MESLWQRTWQIWTNNPPLDRKKTITEKELAQEHQAFYDYFKTTKTWWEKANDLFSFLDHSLMCQVYVIK